MIIVISIEIYIKKTRVTLSMQTHFKIIMKPQRFNVDLEEK